MGLWRKSMINISYSGYSSISKRMLMRRWRVVGPMLLLPSGLLLVLLFSNSGGREVFTDSIHKWTRATALENADLGISKETVTEEKFEVSITQSADMYTRSKFQRAQIDKYCKRKGMEDLINILPRNKVERDLLYRHLLFDDKRKSLFCFVEKVGCTNMKRLIFVSTGALPESTTRDEFVDEKYMEKAIKQASFQSKTLSESQRINKMKKYFKYVMVRNPLERLVSGYRNKIEPPLLGMSDRFPDYIQQGIFKTYRPLEYQRWINSGGEHNVTIRFSEFVRYMIDTNPEKINPHFKPVMHTCHPCRVRYDFYGNFKMYSQDVTMAIEKLGMDPEYYPNQSLHAKGNETSRYLVDYYNRLAKEQKVKLFRVLRDELEFYYYLYPEERDSHVKLLGVDEEFVLT